MRTSSNASRPGRSAPALCGIELMDRARLFEGRTAIAEPAGVVSYDELAAASCGVAEVLLEGRPDLREARVAFLVPPGFVYPAVQWGIWRAGGVAVPLALAHPPPELEYVLADSGAETVVAHPDFVERLAPIARKLKRRFIELGDRPSPGRSPDLRIGAERRAMILYTSGTTGKPKGVVATHENLRAQVTALVRAWEWSRDDRILHILPLHHVHGIVNVLSCALWSGAVCEFLPRFDPAEVWKRLMEGGLTLFMAVPTVYSRLIRHWEESAPEQREAMSAACKGLRLMVCGSAALPVPVLERWEAISGHRLLERYGMTEIGMALSNPLRGERRPGFVGGPLPGVEVRLADESGSPAAPGAPGEIQVRGPAVFGEYWNRPEETSRSFIDGWFRTGDTAVLEEGSYRILGRTSVDIIKTGGYKVSALEIEQTLLEHPAIDECAVVGLPDPEWGERVAAAVRLVPGGELSLDALRAWCKERLAVYKVPSKLLIAGELPRNAMGKVIKPEVARLFRT